MEIACIRRRRALGPGAAHEPADPGHSSSTEGDRRRGRRGRVVLGVAVVAGALLGAGSTRAQATVPAHVSFSLLWTQPLNDAGGPIALSSPNVANLAGGRSVVVGDRAGKVWAFNLASGAGVAGWPVLTGVPIDSTPSVANTTGTDFDSVYIGEGNAATPTSGGYLGITPQGGTQWFVNVQNPATDTAPAKAVQASMAVGNLNGTTDVVAGSLGEVGQAMNAANGAMLPGFPWFQADSNFTTPALGDVYGNGRTDIVEGGDSSAGSAYGVNYTNGGHIRVLSPTGNAGTGNPGGGLVCQFNTDQTVQSSPAVGELGGSVGHRLRHRGDVPRCHLDQRPHRGQRPLRPALGGEARRHHHQQPGAGRRPRQRPAAGGRGHQGRVRRSDLGAQRRFTGRRSGTWPRPARSSAPRSPRTSPAAGTRT